MKTNKFIYALLLGSMVTTTGCIDDFLNLKPLDQETEATLIPSVLTTVRT